jgi:hypothetical protein
VNFIAKCGTREHTAEELTDAPAFNAMIACEVPLISDLLAYIYVDGLSSAPLLPSMNSDVKTPSENDLSFWNDRHLKFRVLILGRANAGKTTILERLTGATIDKAEVWRDGKILSGQVR